MKSLLMLARLTLALPLVSLAGTLEPPSSPDNQASAMFTLDDLYNRVASGAAGVKRAGGFVGPSGGPTNSTGRTLDEIMAVLPSKSDAKVSAQPSDVPSGLKFWGLSANGWGIQTGTAPIAVNRKRTEYVRDISCTNAVTVGGATAVFTGEFNVAGRTASVVDRHGRNLTVLTASDSSVAFVMPPGTGTNDYSLFLDGTSVPVMVYLPDGNGSLLVETNRLPLAYASPVITRVSGCSSMGQQTCQCPVAGGRTITIRGANFGTNASLISVRIGGLPCSNVAVLENDTAITCALPANPAGGCEDVTVTTDGITGTGGILWYAGPVIYQVRIDGDPFENNPTFVTPGTILVIEGSGLTTGGGATVKFGLPGNSFDSLNFTAPVIYVADSEIRCEVPQCVGENLQLRVKVGTQITEPATARLSAPLPEIISGSLRDAVSSQGGVSLLGTRSEGQNVYFDVENLGADISLVTVFMDVTNQCYNVRGFARGSAAIGTIGCTLPLGSGGGHTFTVKALNAISAPGTDVFVYPTGPEIYRITGCSNVSPATVECPTAGGSVLAIEGDHFTSNSLTVWIGGGGAQSDFINSSNIACVLPPGIGKQVPVIVQCGGLMSIPKTYVSYASPSVAYLTASAPARTAGITVTDLPREGGVEIQLHGANFGASGGQVLIGGAPCGSVIHDPANPHGLLKVALPPRSIPPYNDLPLLFINAAGEMSSTFHVSYHE